MNRDARSDESGQTLIFVLVLITSFAILSSALLAAASSSGVIAQKFNLSFRGRMAADVGLEYGVDQVNENAQAPAVNQTNTVLIPNTVDGTVVSVTITDVTLTSLVISTPPACLASGQTFAFTVTTALSSGVARTVSPVWTVSGGPPAATVSQAGLFTAPTVSTQTSYAVQVAYNNVTSTRTVTVKPTCP